MIAACDGGLSNWAEPTEGGVAPFSASMMDLL